MRTMRRELRHCLALTVLLVALAGGVNGGGVEAGEAAGQAPRTGQAAGGDVGLWEGMTEPNAAYDWLRPPDGVFQQALERLTEGREPGVPLYTYQCGEMLGCRQRFRFRNKRSLARLSFLTPIRLVVEDIRRHRSGHEAIPSPEEWNSQRGVFGISLLIQTKQRSDKPRITLRVGEEVLLPAGMAVTNRTLESCWVGGGNRCWRSLLTATFEVAGETALRGTGLIRVEWAKEKAEVPINLDYLR